MNNTANWAIIIGVDLEMEIDFFLAFANLNFHVAPCVELFLCQSETIAIFDAKKRDFWNQLNVSAFCAVFFANPLNEMWWISILMTSTKLLRVSKIEETFHMHVGLNLAVKLHAKAFKLFSVSLLWFEETVV